VMVCMDGFVLTHAVEPVELPEQEPVDAYLPPFRPRQVLDPEDPVTMGALVGPEAYTEVRYLAHAKQGEALDEIPVLATDFAARFGRASGGLIETYRCEGADTVIVALGSVFGTLQELVDERRAQGARLGALAIKSFRPFPVGELRAALSSTRGVIVLERAFSVGVGGIVTGDVRAALAGVDVDTATVIAGLGGRAITRSSLHAMLDRHEQGALQPVHFLDLDIDLVERELARHRDGERGGPHAENILRELGIVAAGPV